MKIKDYENLFVLKWSDWLPALRFFPVMKVIESGTRNHEKGTKTGATKPAMVTEQAAEEMERLRKKVKPQPGQFIFANRKGIPFDVHRLDWAFHRAVRMAGLDHPELTPYWLRLALPGCRCEFAYPGGGKDTGDGRRKQAVLKL
jgi:hypothetical protein